MRPRTLVALAALALPAAANAQAFLENFNAGIPASWSRVDYRVASPSAFLWSLNTDFAFANWTGAGGTCAMACSYAFMGYYDVGLVSPIFVVPAAATFPSLTYTTNWQNGVAFDHADTDISIDGGLSWTTLVAHAADLGNPFAPPPPMVTVGTSLAAYAGASAMIRFHNYSTVTTGLVHDLYWQVDNVTVTPTPGSLALLGAGALCLRRRRRD